MEEVYAIPQGFAKVSSGQWRIARNNRTGLAQQFQALVDERLDGVAGAS